MSSTDAAIDAAQDLIHALQNTAPAIQIATLGNHHTSALISLARILDKATHQDRPPRVTPQKMECQNQPIIENNPNTEKTPNNVEPQRVPIIEAYPEGLHQMYSVEKPYPEKFQKVHLEKKKKF